MNLQTTIEKVLKDTDIMILACKAKGGYKFRQRFRCSDVELRKLLEIAENHIRVMAISLVVAEAMLREPAPSIHPRWDEYVKRRTEYIE